MIYQVSTARCKYFLVGGVTMIVTYFPLLLYFR